MSKIWNIVTKWPGEAWNGFLEMSPIKKACTIASFLAIVATGFVTFGVAPVTVATGILIGSGIVSGVSCIISNVLEIKEGIQKEGWKNLKTRQKVSFIAKGILTGLISSLTIVCPFLSGFNAVAPIVSTALDYTGKGANLAEHGFNFGIMSKITKWDIIAGVLNIFTSATAIVPNILGSVNVKTPSATLNSDTIPITYVVNLEAGSRMLDTTMKGVKFAVDDAKERAEEEERQGQVQGQQQQQQQQQPLIANHRPIHHRRTRTSYAKQVIKEIITHKKNANSNANTGIRTRLISFLVSCYLFLEDTSYILEDSFLPELMFII
jgi:hypothetical protein